MFRPVPGSLLGVTAPAFVVALVDAETTSDAASSRLSMVIAGLIGLAVVIAVSTFFFWRATRPDRAGGGEIGIRWIQPDEQSATWSTAPAPTPTAPPTTSRSTTGSATTSTSTTGSAAFGSSTPSGPPPEAPSPDYGALRARPADG